MEKKLEDYLHLYIPYGIYCETPSGKGKMCTLGILGEFGFGMSPGLKVFKPEEVKPYLRKLSSMSEEEMIEVLLIVNNHPSVDPIDAEELGEIEMFFNDGGNMVDGNVLVGANYSVRCFEGQLCIMDCGSITLHDTGEERRADVYNQPVVFRYLLSKHFDLLGLIDENLAIDASTIKP